MITLTTTVTKSCLKDFLLMRKSFDLYHSDYQIVAAVDQYCYDYLNENFDKLEVVKFDDLEDGDHVSADYQKTKLFENIIDKKFQISLEQDISKTNILLWCDVDHIFINEINPEVLKTMSLVDAAVTPHFSDGFADEGVVGFFNCGFVLISNPEFLKSWRDLYKERLDHNLYYEQKPLEVCIRSFQTLNLPIVYNFGWWKLTSSKFGGNIQKISAEDDIKWLNKPLVNFHFHFFKESGHAYDHNQMVAYFKQLLLARGSQKDTLLMCEIERLQNENL